MRTLPDAAALSSARGANQWVLCVANGAAAGGGGANTGGCHNGHAMSQQRLRMAMRRRALHALQPRPTPHARPTPHTGCAAPPTACSTSSSPPKPNQVLSEQRAVAVKAYLVKQRIDGARLSTRGYGGGPWPPTTPKPTRPATGAWNSSSWGTDKTSIHGENQKVWGSSGHRVHAQHRRNPCRHPLNPIALHFLMLSQQWPRLKIWCRS